ncbi:hypothetical protein IQ235_00740, partial [Oscillatoriales cyanobacterium LEGE 11467]|nr:hypothetical protein [Zarconia navalis LEGE 11467]
MSMAFFRQFVAPALIVLVFLVALVATSARIFLPEGLSAPAPVEEFASPEKAALSSSLQPRTEGALAVSSAVTN